MCLGHGVECLSSLVGEVEVCLITIAATLFSSAIFVVCLYLKDLLKGVEDTIDVLPLFGVIQGTDSSFIISRTCRCHDSECLAQGALPNCLVSLFI